MTIPSKPHFRWDHLLMALLLGAMAVISLVNILGRYLFHYSLAFTEELTINLFVWLTVLGCGLAFERGGQLGMVTVLQILPQSWQRWLTMAHAVLAALLFLAVNLFLLRTIQLEITVFKARSPALGMPVWIYYAGVVAFTPWVFAGIYRGLRAQLAKSANKE